MNINEWLRQEASDKNISTVEYLLGRMEEIYVQTGVRRTIFAACPNSLTVIKAALRSARRNNAPIKFAATLNQVDRDGGYTRHTPGEFVNTVRQEAKLIHYEGLVMIAIDHGGPWLKDSHFRSHMSLTESMTEVKKSFSEAIRCGYDLIHVDPTIDITLEPGKTIDIKTVVARTIELIVHAENFRRANGYPKIAYEVGTEEVHGGLAHEKTFSDFLTLLKDGLLAAALEDVWPCFVVGKVGTDLHTTDFDPAMATRLTELAGAYGSVIKGHYTDYVSNPEEYPRSGMGAANVGPEFTGCEYDGLMELCKIEDTLIANRSVPRGSRLRETLVEAVVRSDRWQKWLFEDELNLEFEDLSPVRRHWLVKTASRYVWEMPEVVASRYRLYQNVERCGIDAEEVVLSNIEKAMDRYFNKFNLVDLNNLLAETTPASEMNFQLA